jgi:hypothetical protein
MNRYLKCATNKSPISYRCGETIVFKVNAMEKCETVPFNFLKWTIHTDDGENKEGLLAIGTDSETLEDTVIKNFTQGAFL